MYTINKRANDTYLQHATEVGGFPHEWKLSKVKPLYKKGDRYDIQNYRPISIISVLAKLLERLMFNRLTPFLHNIKILTDAQNGFRKGKCIETAVQSFIEIIQEALDKGIHSIEVLIDLTKAYRIPKRVLYMNLETIRPRGRPRNGWLDEVREDGRMVGGEEWQEKVYDREEWRRLLRTARNHRILFMPMD